MKKCLLMLRGLFCLNFAARAQRLFQAPFSSYLGRGLEDHKISLFNHLPYEGIGKKVLLEQYPQLWSQTFTRHSLPGSPFLDAFGAVGPNFPRVNAYTDKVFQSALLIDQYGNLEGNFYGYFRTNRFRLLNLLNQQINTRTDGNENQVLDFAPGKRFTTYNAWSYQKNRFSTGVTNYSLKSKEWGGSTQLDPDSQAENSNVEGFIRDAQHTQLSIWANLGDFSFGDFGLSMDVNSHRQTVDWGNYNYVGKENQQSYVFTYKHYFKNAYIKARWQYFNDKSEERVDSFYLNLKDQYWRGVAEWDMNLGAHFILKTRLNLEKRLEQSVRFRPALQADWGFGKNNRFTLSAFANSGQRQNRPLAFHLDRLRDNYSISWQAKPFEQAQKIGLAFSGGFDRDRFLKLVLDRTWFQDKIITQLDRSNKRLIFRSFPQELRRDALELVLGGKIDPAKKLDAHLMYRWEHWSPDLNMPWQADQAAQLRLRWQIRLSQFDAHYLVRGPQNLVDLSSFPTPDQSPLYHRLDFTYSQRFTHFRRDNHWSKRFTLSLQCINLLGRGGEKGQLETGLLLPDVQEPYWSDPQLRNVQVSLRQVF